jgi:predicted nucleic acid-binding protein
MEEPHRIRENISKAHDLDVREILFRLLDSPGTAGSLTTDAYLAALAIEHQAELHSTDADFARFPGWRWSNPFT